jgi:hypothetical protein
MDIDQKPSRESSPDSDRAFPNPETMSTDLEKSTAPGAQERFYGRDPGPPPDGGFEAWLVVLGGFCTVFSSFGWINCKEFVPVGDHDGKKLNFQGIGIFQDYYQDNQLKAYSPSTIAWIPSTESFMLFFWVRPSDKPEQRIIC